MKKEDTKEVTITISGGITDELGMTVFTTICSTKAVINFGKTGTTIVLNLEIELEKLSVEGMLNFSKKKYFFVCCSNIFYIL